MQAKLSAEELESLLAQLACICECAHYAPHDCPPCRARDHIAALERELEEAKRSAWAMSQDVTTLGQQVEALALGEKP